MMSSTPTPTHPSPSRGYTTDVFHAWLLSLDEAQIAADFQRLKKEIIWYDWNVVDGLACYAMGHSKTLGEQLKAVDEKRRVVSSYTSVLGVQTALRRPEASIRIREVAVKGITEIQRDLDLFKRKVMEFVVSDLFLDLASLERKWGDFGKLKHSAIDFDLAAYFDSVKKVVDESNGGGDAVEAARRAAQYFPEIFGRSLGGNDKLAQIQHFSVSSLTWANTKARAGRAARWRPWGKATAAML